jgi:hypothetical protein
VRRTRWVARDGVGGADGFAQFAGRGFVSPGSEPPENGYDDQPAVRQLIVAHDCVAIVDLTAIAAALENVPRLNRPVKHAAGDIKTLSLLCVDRHHRVDDLNNVVRTDRQSVVGRVAKSPRALRADEALSESVKARDYLRWRLGAGVGLFQGY